MKRFMVRALETVSIGVFIGALAIAMPADARTTNASAGRAVGGSQNTCFNVSTVPGGGTAGVSNVCAGGASYAVPLVVDTGGLKTFVVAGQVNAGGTLQCQILTFTQLGAQGQFSAVMTFPPGGGMTTRSVSASVPGGGTGFLFCFMSGNGSARINLLDFLPV